ncbi:hypothetical protein HS7_02870 [Sulfolobales archaeon HS-7]|nr:hypothetical protein HS7_02870 [Sulfolobales archaeon HS-7]
MYIQTAYNAVNFNNQVSNTIMEPVYPVVLDNEAGIVIKFSEGWSNVEYHEGRIIVYRNYQGNITTLEVEYDE